MCKLVKLDNMGVRRFDERLQDKVWCLCRKDQRGLPFHQGGKNSLSHQEPVISGVPGLALDE